MMRIQNMILGVYPDVCMWLDTLKQHSCCFHYNDCLCEVFMLCANRSISLFRCFSVMQFITEHDPFTGVTAITHGDHQSSALTRSPGDGFHLPSNHSVLRTRLQKTRNMFYNKPDQITCDVCGKRFKFPCDLKRHSVMHTGERVYKCEECQKRFKLLSHLKMHIYRFHARERPYQCDSCGKRYASVTDLRSHALIHSSERPHVCSICNKGFVSAKDLRKHVQIHTGEREFECDVCKRKFLRRGHLEKHIAVVHVHKSRHDCRSRSRKLKFLDQKIRKKWFQKGRPVILLPYSSQLNSCAWDSQMFHREIPLIWHLRFCPPSMWRLLSCEVGCFAVWQEGTTVS